ncbi:hypothetical protein CR205_03465 [Alteribacter lacisalsi]|uniref:DUF4190 domain-containing protein n=1 Tax=Alteribacter lacisalsi TaxID=2045244 RepID=A0A2W0H734_9BACI|nr:DUF4190 domain-containing protein [Alteribacter lacisalsi]PYZ97664.1 hypothetical protein CR205_03465 [Alteribacter lacisalsi]
MTESKTKTTNPKATAAMIFGLISIVLFLLPFVSIVLAIAAIVVGVMALRDMRTSGEKGRTYAMTGIITGVIGLVIPAALGILAYLFFTNQSAVLFV